MRFEASTATRRTLRTIALVLIAWGGAVAAQEESPSPDRSPEPPSATSTAVETGGPGSAGPDATGAPPTLRALPDPSEAGLDIELEPDFFGDGTLFRVVEGQAEEPGPPLSATDATSESIPSHREPEAVDPIVADATSELEQVEAKLAARRAELEKQEAELERRRQEISSQRSELQDHRAELSALESELDKKRAELASLEAKSSGAPTLTSAPKPDQPLARAPDSSPAIGAGIEAGAPQSTAGSDAEASIPSPHAAASAAAVPPEAGETSRSESTPSPRGDSPTLLGRLAAGLPSALRGSVEGLSEKLPGSPAQQLGLLLAALGILVAIALRLLRRRGDLAVSVDYPDELRGTFRVRIATSESHLGRDVDRTRKEVLKGGISTTSEHHLVRRETSFRGLPCRRYFLVVEGLLQDPDTQEVLLDCRDNRSVRLQPRRTVRAELDFRPSESPIDVLVSWDAQPARDAAIAVRGSPRSLRSRREGPVRLGLPKGKHTLVVGCGDRVMEHEIDVQSFLLARVEINVAGAAEVIFKGCPPAVRPYLVGEIEVAAEALERDGQSDQAQLLLARFELERGNLAVAAEHFEAAEHWIEAAEHQASLSNFPRAAELFKTAGDFASAAEMFQLAEEWLCAGEAYETARDYDNAIVCFREAGAVSRWIDALERQGRGFEAAGIALDNGESNRGIGLLQRVPPDDPDYAEACSLLASAFEHEGHYDLAIQKIEDQLAASSTERLSGKLHGRLADLLEQAGIFERALEVLEDLRHLQPTYPNIATRIEVLRKQCSNNQPTPHSGPTNLAGTPTMFLDQHRYEMLEEIGRGGMGVVFKARDRRLGRVVALKRLPENLRRDHPNAVELFLREARSTAGLNHPNIVTVYDTDQEDDCFFITMELLKGRPLHRILRERDRLPAIEVASLGAQVASGLDYAHQVGVIHRDIKTSTLFLTEDGVVKIMDFGLAKMLEELRSSSSVVGTPFYMAPEQALGKPVDHRADLYALGVTLFELLTGELPFRDVTSLRREETLDDLRARLTDTPDLLVELVLQLLAENADERCDSAAEVLMTLDDVLSQD